MDHCQWHQRVDGSVPLLFRRRVHVQDSVYRDRACGDPAQDSAGPAARKRQPTPPHAVQEQDHVSVVGQRPADSGRCTRTAPGFDGRLRQRKNCPLYEQLRVPLLFHSRTPPPGLLLHLQAKGPHRGQAHQQGVLRRRHEQRHCEDPSRSSTLPAARPFPLGSSLDLNISRPPGRPQRPQGLRSRHHNSEVRGPNRVRKRAQFVVHVRG